MAVQMNIAEAKAKLSELVARAEAGEEVIIARDGAPAVVLKPALQTVTEGDRPLGLWAHLNPSGTINAAAFNDEPLYSESDLDEMIEDWGVPRAPGK